MRAEAVVASEMVTHGKDLFLSPDDGFLSTCLSSCTPYIERLLHLVVEALWKVPSYSKPHDLMKARTCELGHAFLESTPRCVLARLGSVAGAGGAVHVTFERLGEVLRLVADTLGDLHVLLSPQPLLGIAILDQEGASNVGWDPLSAVLDALLGAAGIHVARASSKGSDEAVLSKEG